MTAGPESVVPDVRLERFRLGELPEPDMEALRERLARDPGLRARLEGLARSDADIAERYPASRMAAAIRQRLNLCEPQAPRQPFWLRAAPAAALAVLLLAVVLPVALRFSSPPDIVRVKGGGPSLVVYRRLPGGSERLEPGAPARAGDQVRLAYRATGRAHGVIVSVDPRGTVTRHLPTQGQQAARLEPDGLVMLDAAYELDATPGWERFYFVTGDRPFEVEAVVRAARAAAAAGTAQAPPALALPRALDQFVFTLTKDDRE